MGFRASNLDQSNHTKGPCAVSGQPDHPDAGRLPISKPSFSTSDFKNDTCKHEKKVPTEKSTPPDSQISNRRALDLFSGGGSVSKRLKELGYEVVSLNIDPRCKPSILTDILRWKYAKKNSTGLFWSCGGFSSL